MSLAESEAELEKLTPDELRRLAMLSWTACVEKEGRLKSADECDEDDPVLLAALDEAIAKMDAAPTAGHSGREVRARLSQNESPTVEILRCWDAHRQSDPAIPS